MPASRLQRQLVLGRRYLEVQSYAQAILEVDKAIAIDPMNVEAYLCKTEAYIGLDKFGSYCLGKRLHAGVRGR